MDILAVLLILGAIACFIVEVVRTGFGLLALGLGLMAAFLFVALAIPLLQG